MSGTRLGDGPQLFVDYLRKILPGLLQGYPYRIGSRLAVTQKYPLDWEILVEGCERELPMGSVEGRTGLFYVRHLLSEKFGSAFFEPEFSAKWGDGGELWTPQIVFTYRPEAGNTATVSPVDKQQEKTMEDLIQPEVGMVLDGYCNGYFDDSFENKSIDAVANDYIVVRSDEGGVCLVETAKWGGKIPQEWRDGEVCEEETW